MAHDTNPDRSSIAAEPLLDDLGTPVLIDAVPTRLVSLVPSLTETLAHWGLADRLIGVTDWCTTPELPGVARVRGTKNPDLAEIGRLQPDLVIANREENRRVDVERLREAGIPVWVTAPEALAEVTTTFRRLGTLLDVAAAANRLADEIVDALHEASDGPGLRTFCPVWRDPWIAVGTGTISADLLAHAGFDVVPRESRYPRVALDDVAALDPDVVVLPDEPYAFGPADLDAFRGWRAAIRFVDGTALTWWGPRTPRALVSFRTLARSVTRSQLDGQRALDDPGV